MSYVGPERAQTVFSIDLTTSGPNVVEHNLLRIGGCLVEVGLKNRVFEAILKPITKNEVHSYHSVHGITLGKAEKLGQNAGKVMSDLKSWIHSCSPYQNEKVCVGYSLLHDWPFLEYYFSKYCNSSDYYGQGPFKQNCICLKTLFSTKTGTPISKITKALIRKELGLGTLLTYNSVQLAVENAEIYYKLTEIG